MAIEKPSETAAHRRSYERGRQAGFREGIAAAVDIIAARHADSKNDRVVGAMWEVLQQVRALLPDDGQNTAK